MTEIKDRFERLQKIPSRFQPYFGMCKTEEEWEAIERIIANVLNNVVIDQTNPPTE